MEETVQQKFYEKAWFAWVMVFLFLPVGIYLMFKYDHHSKGVRISVAAIGSFILIVGFVTDGDSEQADTAENEEPEVVEEEPEEENNEQNHNEENEVEEIAEDIDLEEDLSEEVEASSSDDMTEGEYLFMIELVKAMLEENFGGIADTYYEEAEKTFVIEPTDPSFSTELVMIVEGSMPPDDWHYLTEETRNLSDIISENLGGSYSVAITNPQSPDRVLFMATNGTVIYDVLND